MMGQLIPAHLGCVSSGSSSIIEKVFGKIKIGISEDSDFMMILKVLRLERLDSESEMMARRLCLQNFYFLAISGLFWLTNGLILGLRDILSPASLDLHFPTIIGFTAVNP